MLFNTSLLAPAAMLIAWSIIMLFWMASTRLPAASKAGVNIGASVGGRGQDIDPVVPQNVAWKSHNYSHLMEQPTIFYAVIMLLTLADNINMVSIGLAWGYILLRILHSLWQVLVNTVKIRFLIFLAATFCLIGLSVMALIATF
jgi:hypothetical protein